MGNTKIKTFIWLFFSISSNITLAEDIVQKGVLNIEEVRIRDNIYSDVDVTISEVIAVKSGTPLANIDGYYPDSKELFVPAVKYKGKTFTNVLAKVNQILKAGDVLSIYNSPVYSYSSSVISISYPDSYLTESSSFDFSSRNPCDLDFQEINIPKFWMGEKLLPEINGAPFPDSIKAGMGIKDIYLTDNPAFILNGAKGAEKGCYGTASLKDEIDKTLTRFSELGVEYAYIPQWHWLEITPNGTWRIMEAERTFGPLIDDDLEYFIERAHQLGMKTIMYQQIQGAVNSYESGDYENVSYKVNEQNFEKWLYAYSEFMRERINYFDSIGLDIVSLTCDTCIFSPRETDFDPSYFEKYLDVIEQLYELVISETNLMTNISLSDLDNETYESVAKYADYLSTSGNILNEHELEEYTVENVKNNYSTYELGEAIKFGKPIIHDLHPVQSRDTYSLFNGYLEETVCTSGYDWKSTGGEICVQELTIPDFAIQAIIHEGVLESLNSFISENIIENTLIFMHKDYYVTDNMMPYTAFPALGTSIRNKPAEGIFKRWFEN